MEPKFSILCRKAAGFRAEERTTGALKKTIFMFLMVSKNVQNSNQTFIIIYSSIVKCGLFMAENLVQLKLQEKRGFMPEN